MEIVCHLRKHFAHSSQLLHTSAAKQPIKQAVLKPWFCTRWFPTER